MTIKLVHSEEGDWTGLYRDGELLVQDHRLTVEDVLEALEINFAVEQVLSQEYLNDAGRLPVKYSEIPKDVFVEVD